MGSRLSMSMSIHLRPRHYNFISIFICSTWGGTEFLGMAMKVDVETGKRVGFGPPRNVCLDPRYHVCTAYGFV